MQTAAERNGTSRMGHFRTEREGIKFRWENGKVRKNVPTLIKKVKTLFRLGRSSQKI